MPHINLPEGLQGIRGPMAFRPETAKPLNELAEILLHAPNSLAPGERELIATYVSSLNDYTSFQAQGHEQFYGDGEKMQEEVFQSMNLFVGHVNIQHRWAILANRVPAGSYLLQTSGDRFSPLVMCPYISALILGVRCWVSKST